MAVCVGAALRSVHMLSGNILSSQAQSMCTFSGCLSLLSKRNEKGNGKGFTVASVPSHNHSHTGMAATNYMLFPTFRKFFCASSKEESAIGICTDASVAFFSSASDADSASSNVSSSQSADSIKDSADLLDIRVGRILRAWRHPEADSLYVEEVDIGEPEPRTICSGLIKYIPLDDLQNAMVIVLANLKPRNMRGVKSNGMLLAVSDASHENVELLVPPEGAVLGERIWFGSKDEGEHLAAATPNQIQKKKIWELVQPHLKTNDFCVGVLGEHYMRTSAGVVVCRSLLNGNIS